MFTGIVLEIGKLVEIGQSTSNSTTGVPVKISCNKILTGLQVGDSVACNGVCLTATQIGNDTFTAYAVPETLQRTNLGNLKIGNAINLETALTPSTPMGGHHVQGHVDGIAKLVTLRILADKSRELIFQIQPEHERYCVHKGSIAFNGVSLTLARVEGLLCTIALIPHTLLETNLGTLVVGAQVNYEVDVLGRYVEKLLMSKKIMPESFSGSFGSVDSWSDIGKSD